MPRPRKADLTIDDIREQGKKRQKQLREKRTDAQKEAYNEQRRIKYALKHPPKYKRRVVADSPARAEEPEPAPVFELEPVVADETPRTFGQAYDILKAQKNPYASPISTVIKNLGKNTVISDFVKPGVRTQVIALKKQNGGDPELATVKQWTQAILNVIRIFKIRVSAEGHTELKKLMDEEKLGVHMAYQSKEKDAVPWWKDYLKNLASKFSQTSKEAVVARLYQVLPLRDDFKKLTVLDTPPSDNVKNNSIQVPKSGPVTVYLEEFKTKGLRFPAEQIPLPIRLSNTIRAYIRENKIKTGGYLFGSQSLGPFLGKLNEKLGYGDQRVNFYRYMSAPHIGNTLTPQERAEIAHRMKHSTSSQEKYMRHRLPSNHWN